MNYFTASCPIVARQEKISKGLIELKKDGDKCDGDVSNDDNDGDNDESQRQQ